MKGVLNIAVLVGCMLFSTVATAAYPDKSIRLVVPYAPAGGTDLLARVIAEKLGSALGQSVIVENKPGANGVIGTNAVVGSAPDGYTLLLGGMGPMAVNQAIMKDLAYNALSDLAPIVTISSAALVLAANPKIPVGNAKELIAYTHAHPGTVFAGNAGNGSPHHLCTGLFTKMTGADLTSVAYKGAGPAIVDLIAGNIQVLCDNVGTIRQQIESGQVKAIAVTTKARTDLLPDVPTLAEQGISDFEFSLWFSLLAPAGTPPDVLQRLNTEMNTILEMPEVKEKLANLGSAPVGGSIEDATNHIAGEHARWSEQANEIGLKQE